MISAVVLAAGESTRMGICKQLLDVEGKAMIEHVIESLQESRIDEIVVVLGCMAEEVASKLPKKGVKTVFNSRYKEGQSTSIKIGLEAIDPRADAAIFLLSDQPFVGAKVLDRLVEEYERTHTSILIPTYKGRRGNPVLMDRTLFQESIRVSGDVGARSVVLRHEDEVVEVEVDEPGILFDVDTIEDLEAVGEGLPREGQEG